MRNQIDFMIRTKVSFDFNKNNNNKILRIFTRDNIQVCASAIASVKLKLLSGKYWRID